MRRAFAITFLAFCVSVVPAAAANEFSLTVMSQTNTTITFSYPQQPGYGYLYSANGVVVSQTNDPAKTQVKFSKNSANSYEVASKVKGTTGSCCTPPPPAGPAAPTNVSVTSVTQTGMTVVWSAVTGATNYRIYRAGNQIGQGPGSSGGYADAWADSGLACGTSYVYAVDAQNANGDSPKTSVTGTTVACNNPPPPPPPSTITPAQFQTMAVTGATIQNVTVTGSVSINVANLTLLNSVVQGTINLGESANTVTVSAVTAVDFDANGSDNITITGSTFDAGPGNSCQSFIWPGANRNPSTGWTITNNTFRDYQCTEPHSEALYIASDAAHGLIEGNVFTNNGNTSHIFFTWCNDKGGAQNFCNVYGQNNGAPHDWSVRDNTFYDTWTAYFAINARDELANTPGLNLCVDNHQSVTGPVIPPASGNGGLAQFMYPPVAFMLKPSCPDPR